LNRGRSPGLAVKTVHLDEHSSVISRAPPPPRRRRRCRPRDTLFAIEKRVSDKENRTTELGRSFAECSHQRGGRGQKERLEQQ